MIYGEVTINCSHTLKVNFVGNGLTDALVRSATRAGIHNEPISMTQAQKVTGFVGQPKAVWARSIRYQGVISTSDTTIASTTDGAPKVPHTKHVIRCTCPQSRHSPHLSTSGSVAIYGRAEVTWSDDGVVDSTGKSNICLPFPNTIEQ